MTTPIGIQIACVRHAVNERQQGDTVRDGLEAAMATLEWFRKYRSMIIAGKRLWDDPVVPALFEALPGSEFLELPHASLEMDGAEKRG